MNTFTRKSYGVIYVYDKDRIPEVIEIIKGMDYYEWEYMPDGFIKPFSDYPEVKYTHKFDSLNIDALTAICWSKGIHIWAFDAREEYPDNEVEKFNQEK